MSDGPATFETNPRLLKTLLNDAHSGILQLPDFQRSWVWDEERIKSLVASVSRGFPIGALMTLQTGGEVEFKPRLIEGVPAVPMDTKAASLLLDGQQRVTSLYQVAFRNAVVETVTPKNRKVRRWFYLDMVTALDPDSDREEAVIGVPEDRVLRSDFGRSVELDLSSRLKEIENLHYPISEVFRFDEWMSSFWESSDQFPDFQQRREVVMQFKSKILERFTEYQIPVITLGRETSREAVCVVFEKVNTGGKALDAFELITAMYAAEGHELRKDWFGEGSGEPGRADRLRQVLRLPSQDAGVLAGVGNTDFMQIIALFHTRDRRAEASAEGRSGKDLPQVSATRQTLLSLPLSAYLKYEAKAEAGLVAAAKFLISLGIFRVLDLPYQSQVVPLAAILAELGSEAESRDVRDKLEKWYWNGVFGELYGSSTETRIAKDFIEVVSWARGSGDDPSTIRDATVRADRLLTMRTRLSAAYKGVSALLLKAGARDIRTGQPFDKTVFFDENVDIHHLFPQDWCKKRGIDRRQYDSILNKSPLSARTNRMIGGKAPSQYLTTLEEGENNRELARVRLADAISSHLASPELLRSDDFYGFLEDRQRRIIVEIERAIGQQVYYADLPPEEGDDVDELDALSPLVET